MTVSVKGFSLGCGIVGLVYMLVLGVMSMFMGMGDPFVIMLGSVMMGFDSTMMGMIFGAVWGFVLGLVGGAIVAGVNNSLGGGKLPPIKEYKRIEEGAPPEAPPEAPPAAPPEAPPAEPPAYSPYPESEGEAVY